MQFLAFSCGQNPFQCILLAGCTCFSNLYPFAVVHYSLLCLLSFRSYIGHEVFVDTLFTPTHARAVSKHMNASHVIAVHRVQHILSGPSRSRMVVGQQDLANYFNDATDGFMAGDSSHALSVARAALNQLFLLKAQQDDLNISCTSYAKHAAEEGYGPGDYKVFTIRDCDAIC